MVFNGILPSSIEEFAIQLFPLALGYKFTLNWLFYKLLLY